MREGDAGRLLNFLKIALLLPHSHNSVKYAYVVLFFLAKIYAILPKGIAIEVLLNRFFNSLAKAGGNIPLDLRMELLKLALKQLGANINKKGAQRIAKSLQAVENILVNVDSDCNLAKPRSGYHRSKRLGETVTTITKDLCDEKVFDVQPGRACPSFEKFKMNFLNYNWGSTLFTRVAVYVLRLICDEVLKRLSNCNRNPGEGWDSHMKKMGMLVVLLGSVNFECLVSLRVSGAKFHYNKP